MGEINGPKISVNSVNYTGIQKQNIELCMRNSSTILNLRKDFNKEGINSE